MLTRASKSLKETWHNAAHPEPCSSSSPPTDGEGCVTAAFAGSAGSPESVGEAPQSQLRKERTKSKELAAWFGIPEGEVLLADFHCALRKRVLLQGRLFVFDSYICFSSSVFGFTERKAISLADVESVTKKTYLKFPNSIEVQDCNGQRDFFTSFLTRESAFRSIITAWAHVRPELAEPLLASFDEDTGQTYRKTTNSVMNIFTGSSSIFFWDGKKKKEPTLTEDQDAAPEDQDPSSSCLANAVAGEVEGTVMPRGLSLCDMDGKQEEEGHDESSETMWNRICMEAEPVPCHKDSKVLMSTQLPGTLRDFFDLFIASDSPFYEEVLVEQGNRKIDISAWKAAEQLGHVRDVQFVAPIKGAFSSWGVPTTRCFVTQRFCRYPNQHLLFETSQTNLDIPYGDYFTVDMRWDVRADPSCCAEDPRVLLEMHVRTSFSRTCLFRKIIESGVYSQAKDTYDFILAQANLVLRRRVTARKQQHVQAALAQASPASPTLLPLSARRSMGMRPTLDPGLMGGGMTPECATTPTPASRASGRRGGGSGNALPTLAVGAGGSGTPAAAGLRGLLGRRVALSPGDKAAGRGWAWSVQPGGLLLTLLLLLMCAVQLYMLLLLQPRAANVLPEWARDWAMLPGQSAVGQGDGSRLAAASHASPGSVHAGAAPAQPQQQDVAELLQVLQVLQRELSALQQRADTATAQVACLTSALSSCTGSHTLS